MISWITIVLFFVYCWGLGFTALSFVQKKPELRLERFCLAVALGLGIFPILAVLLNFVHIPLDWKVFLGLSLVWPIVIFIRKMKKNELNMPQLSFSFTKSELMLCGAIVIMLLSLFMYTKGAFAYPYLEDEDPWGHAVGAKYVALEKIAYDPVLVEQKRIDEVLAYIDPYPPAYDVLMGVLHQTSPDLNWTLKFFNALIISFGVLFFYLFAKEFVGDNGKALLATFFLAVIPSYFSHFIWAHSYVVMLFFPAMYALLMIKEDGKWMWIALVMIASIWVTQNIEEPIKLTTMLLLFVIVASVVHRQFLRKEFAAICGGVLLSFVWWGVMVVKYGYRDFIRAFTGSNILAAEQGGLESAVSSAVGATGQGSFLHKLAGIFNSLTSSGGTASRAYSFNDFFVAKGENLINAPIGIGIVLSLLAIGAVLYVLWHYRSRLMIYEQMAITVSLFWFIYTFWGVNGQTFLISIARGPFRMWLLLSIPLALLAAEGVYYLVARLKRWNIPAVIIIVIVILGVLFTSGYQKYQLNTAMWPTSGAYSNAMEPFEYAAWFHSVPLNTKVFLYVPRDKLVIGLGGESCLWCQEVIDFRKDILHQDAVSLHTFLKQQGYEYIILNGNMDRKMFTSQFGVNETEKMLPQRYDEIQKSSLFKSAYYKENMFLVLKVI